MNATHDKKQKDKARKRGASLRRKVVELGKHCDILSAVIYWNPTRKALEAVMYLPDGQVVPDLNQLVNISPVSSRLLLCIDWPSSAI